MLFTCRPPVECIHILQDGQHSLCGKDGSYFTREVSGRQMGLTKQHEHKCIGMAPADLRKFLGRVAVPCSYLAQVFARHAVQAIDGIAVLARGN